MFGKCALQGCNQGDCCSNKFLPVPTIFQAPPPKKYWAKPSDDAIVALQQLARDGMHLHVGPHKHNYISGL
jgi:hypothetical protein